MNAVNTSYSPIDCGLYDHLEIAAMRRRDVTLVYHDEHDQPQISQTRIADLFSTEAQEEFAVLADGTHLRLDRLIQLDDIVFDGKACKL